MTRSITTPLLLSLLLAAACRTTTPPAPPTAGVSMAVETYTLPNGLTVTLHEDHAAPLVAVNIWYHVGSKNEEPGRTGFAHLFEHVMFQGSLHHNSDHFVAIQSIGGQANGGTTYDFTKYWEVVPSNALEYALWLEADRMANLLPSLSEARFENQRQVVKNEKRERYDNPPLGDVVIRVGEMLYPAGHPYHLSTIGSMADLDRASLDDVRAFFRRYYTPNNAAIAITGDFDRESTRRIVERLFGVIPRGPAVAQTTAPPPVSGLQRASMTDRVSAPHLFVTWTAPPQFTADEAAVDLMTSILGDGRRSRLASALIYDRELADNIDLGFNTRELMSEVRLNVTAAGGISLALLEQAVDAEIARLQEMPPTEDEVRRAFNVREAAFIDSMQSTYERSDLLGYYTLFQGRGDFLERDIARYRSVTPADVQRVAKKYLRRDRVVFAVEPGKEKTPLADLGSGTPHHDAAMLVAPPPVDLGPEPRVGPAPALKLPAIQRTRLANGLDVMVVERHKLPTVNINLVVRSGAADDPDARPGLAAITAAMLDKGTTTRNATELASTLGNVGARLEATTDYDSTTVSLKTLTRHLDAVLPIFADAVLHPAVPAHELEVESEARRATLAQSRQNARSLAAVLMPRLLYGPSHPYGRPIAGAEESLRAITRDDVLAFHDERYRPNNATVIVVGDVDAHAIAAKLESTFGAWQPKTVEPRALPAAAAPATTLYAVDRPGSAQASIQIAGIGVPRTSPDYIPLLVLNTALGGSFGSRLNQKLRESSGISYNPRSTFAFRRDAGPFAAAADVQSSAAARGVAEMLGEIEALRTTRPLTGAELETAKRNLVASTPRLFDTPDQVARQLTPIALYGLPADYFNTYVARILAVTAVDVERAAARDLDPSKLTIVVVGDMKSAEPELRALSGVGATFTRIDARGEPVR